jgi:hypothetical protein
MCHRESDKLQEQKRTNVFAMRKNSYAKFGIIKAQVYGMWYAKALFA